MVDRCTGCGSGERIKAGIHKGNQRYRCKDCGRHYSVAQHSRIYPQATRRLALEMYLEGLGFRAIGRILKVSYVTVFGWIKEMGGKAEELKSEDKVEVVELDEMHTYVGNKRLTSGYGLLLIDIESGSSLLSLDAGEKLPVQSL